MEILLNSKRNEYLLGSLEPMYIYKIEYSYATKRKNLKKRSQKVIASQNIDAKCKFIDYINEFNRNYPHRELSNVEILGIKCVDEIKLKIE